MSTASCSALATRFHRTPSLGSPRMTHALANAISICPKTRPSGATPPSPSTHGSRSGPDGRPPLDEDGSQPAAAAEVGLREASLSATERTPASRSRSTVSLSKVVPFLAVSM
eukprot:CAMPEP_0170189354 /NCGR_PEP_ID=MMETSP0040_2-20121228/46634_1 /TAXON_ID=641309 /ORGANISM="Lotharella oceanica, Strain CCMP622" /LENGTH=111 /DNA_ID=CAMNT_0010436909 /DNA_START=390 /DNA_END=725 /DNA_ORIENTATION=-